MKFDIFKTLSLAHLGEEWKDCELKFRYITVQESKELLSLQVDKADTKSLENAYDQALKILTDKFVSGKMMSDGKLVEIKKENIPDLPSDVVNQCILLLTTVTEDKKKE